MWKAHKNVRWLEWERVLGLLAMCIKPQYFFNTPHEVSLVSFYIRFALGHITSEWEIQDLVPDNLTQALCPILQSMSPAKLALPLEWWIILASGDFISSVLDSSLLIISTAGGLGDKQSAWDHCITYSAHSCFSSSNLAKNCSAWLSCWKIPLHYIKPSL